MTIRRLIWEARMLVNKKICLMGIPWRICFKITQIRDTFKNTQVRRIWPNIKLKWKSTFSAFFAAASVNWIFYCFSVELLRKVPFFVYSNQGTFHSLCHERNNPQSEMGWRKGWEKSGWSFVRIKTKHAILFDSFVQKFKVFFRWIDLCNKHYFYII